MMAELFWMDGNGPYVWGAWLVGAVLLKACLALALLHDRRLARRVEALEAGRTRPGSGVSGA